MVINMNKTQLIVVAVVAVVVVAGISAYILMANDEGDEDRRNIETELAVFGNANNDYIVDGKDKEVIESIIDGEATLSKYPMADANDDGKVDSIMKSRATVLYITVAEDSWVCVHAS